MTAETEVSEAYKGETVGACDLDMSSYEDLQKGGGECNGVSQESGEGVIGNGKGDSDCSYVFVSGRDVLSDDYAKEDLNVESLPEPDHPMDEQEVQAGELRIQNGENDQLHEVEDCCDVEGTVVSSSNNRYMQVESTGVLVLEGDLFEEPNSGVDVESGPPQPNVVITEEQTTLGSGAEEQTGSGYGAEEQTGLESSVEEQTGLESGVDEQTVLESGVDEQTGLESGVDEQTVLESGVDEQTGLESGVDEQTGLESGVDEQTGLESGVDEQTGLESGGEEKTGLESGGEEKTGLESGGEEQTGLELGGEEQTGLESGGEEQTGYETGAEEQTRLETGVEEQISSGPGAEEQTGSGPGSEEQTGSGPGAVEQTGSGPGAVEQTGSVPGAVEQTGSGPGSEEQTGSGPGSEEQTSLDSGEGSGVEQTSLGSGLESRSEKQTSVEADPEPNRMVVGKAQSQIVVPEALGCELMHSDNENPKVDGSWGFHVPSTECDLLHAQDREEKDDEQNAIESISEVTESQGFEDVTTNSDECDLHQLNKAHEKVKEESESFSQTGSQESEIKVSEDVPFEEVGEKRASDLENDLSSEGPSVEIGLNLEHDLKMPSAKINMQSEAEVAVGSVLDENGDGLPVECSSSETEAAANNCNQIAPELYVCSGNDRSLSPYTDCVRSESTVDVSVEKEESLPTCLDNGPMVEQEEKGVSLITEDFPTCAADVAEQETRVGSFDPINKNAVPRPDGGTKSESEAENGLHEDDTILACSSSDVRSKTIISFGSIRFPCGDGNVEPRASKVTPKCSSCKPVNVDVRGVMASELKDPVKNGSNLPTSAETKSESEVENASLSYKDAVSRTKVLNGSDVNSGSVINSPSEFKTKGDQISTKDINVENEGDQISTKDINVENEGDQITSVDGDDKLTCQEAGSVLGNGASSLEVLSVDALDSHDVPVEVGKRPFYFLIKVPRYDDEKIREEIKLAQLQVDEKTKSRDAIRSEIQRKRVACKEYNENFEAALSEERAARELLKSKFQEIDSVQSVINRVKNAMSVKDIDGRIRHMEHAIEHETLPLKEEKQLIRDIKQLRNVREQLSSNMGRQEEVQQALDQRSQVEEQSKLLREEVDSLRNKVQKAEVITKAAKKKYHDEIEKLNELLARFKAADYIRQEAYAHLQSLRKKLSEKNKYFRMYKDDLKAANDYVSAGDKEALQHLCVNEVEIIMELWNNNDEFRKEYIRCNTRSTLRRLRTLDGRSLGPDEEPPVLPNSLNDFGRSLYAPAKDISVPTVSTVEQEKQMVPAEAEKVDDKSTLKVANQKNQTGKSKNHTKLATGAVSPTISGRDVIEETKEEEHKQTKEEEELMRRAEELRKEEEAAKLKEQLRLEEKAKAKEALERKKRNAEKAQVRAELRAQKEAEHKQREMEKKARKRERRKASPAEATNGCNEAEYVASSETPSESTLDSESIEKPRTIGKTPHKPSQFTKQTKSKSIPPPPPIRNRGKRRIQSWMWVLLMALLVLALFLLGNTGLSSRLGLQSFGF